MGTFFKDFSAVDYVALAAIAFLVIRGFIIGGSGEIGRLVGLLSAVTVGYFGFAPVSRVVLSAHLFNGNPQAGRFIAFILLAVVCIALWLGLRRLLADAVRLAVAQPFDAILGGVFGGIQAFVLVAGLCALGLLSPREKDRTQFQQHSVTAQTLAPYLKKITAPES